MPIYEYRCNDCHAEFERLVKFSDPPLTACPTCGGTVHKLISQSGFVLKGTGWYVTDYARKDQGGKAAHREKSDESKVETPSSSDASPKADKPAETTAPAPTDASSTKTSPPSSSGTKAAA